VRREGRGDVQESEEGNGQALEKTVGFPLGGKALQQGWGCRKIVLRGEISIELLLPLI
jgi:hypothetical protein